MTSKSPQLPDIATFLLPTRAYLLSMKEQNLSLRRAALIDAESHFRERLDSDGEASELTRRALVGFIGEVFQILEDLAAYADSLLNAPSGTAFFAALTDYSRTRVNDFYTQLRKRPSEYFSRLLALRFGETAIEDLLKPFMELGQEELAAITEGHEATARCIERHLVRLAEEWQRALPYSHAYRHGLLVVNQDDITLLDDEGNAVEAIVVWRRRKEAPEGAGYIPAPYGDMTDHVVSVGELALDVLEHLIKSRLNMFELIEFRADGTYKLKPPTKTPWLWWFKSSDVSDRSKDILSNLFGMDFR